MSKPVIVIGAGIVGVSTAIWLQRFGYEVVLVDKGQPGMGASYGNAGLIAQWAVAPVTTPDLWGDLPKYLLNPNSPLFLKWLQAPKMMPWLVRFLSHATDKTARKTSTHIADLISDAVEQHRSLASGTPLESWISDSKFSFAYKTSTDFKHDAYAWQLKKEAGFNPTILTGNDVQEAEPILGSNVKCLAVLEGQGHITNPAQYITELADFFVANGGKFVQAKVVGFTRANGHVSAVETDNGSIECSRAVVTSGIWSKDLMKTLGLRVPLQAERGYHVLFKNPSQMLNDPMMITWGKFGANPMDTGLRCAGTVELGDHHAGPSKSPIKVLRRCASEAFPDLEYGETEEWMGFRPSTYDSLPLIGQIGESGIYAGFGHQHVGLTAGPKTGRMLAQIIDGRSPNADITPYTPARFGV
ncbi:MAG: FAD-binding oxidoreductase [Paracoccaceae bacterium]|nr:FAD-binding oxidoreductase [Paracoccaceae bacterium]